MWQLAWCDNDQPARIDYYLHEGWEPFAVCVAPGYPERIYFRRKVQA